MPTEYFLDDAGVEDLQTVARTIVRPTKHASNPVMGNAAWTWDRDINYVQPFLDGGTTKIWYMGVTTARVFWACYATSTDGITFTKPTLGRFKFAGRKNNNIVLASTSMITSVYVNAALTPAHLGVGAHVNGTAANGVHLFSSADGTTWSFLKTLFNSGADSNYKEGNSLARRADGRWLVYYAHGHLNERRQIGAFLSDTTDPAGAWTDQGVFIDTNHQDFQRYFFATAPFGAVSVGLASRYNKTTEKVSDVALLVSRDGVTWRSVDPTWFSVGTSGTWDDEMIIPSLPFCEHGSEWWGYYTGFPANHAAGLPRESRIGIVVLPKGRFVGIGTTGTVRTTPIVLGAGQTLTVNANASGGGSVRAALLNADGQPLTGYSLADCTPVTTDTFGTAVSWGGQSLPANQTVRLVFVLDAASLYSYDVG